MNFIALIVLSALLADFFLNFAADYLNIKSISVKIPGPFKDVYDTEKYEKSQAYLMTNTRFGWVAGVFDLLVLLLFWFLKGFSYLDQWVRSLDFGPVISGLIFIGALLILKSFLSIPFGAYATFVIEERYGFNRTTLRTWVTDKIKGLFLALVIGVPLLATVLWFFQTAGGHAWWYCWVVVTLISLVIQFVAPSWIMPLFNRFEPLEEGELKKAILDYARSINFPLKNIYVMDGSKRSGKSNAFFTGFGKFKRIVLFDTLISQHTTSELVAVLGHEMGHYKKKHILKMLIWGVMQTGLTFYVLSLAISQPPLFSAFYVKDVSIYAGLIFFGMLYAPMDFFFGLVAQALSRKHEFEADRFAAETTGRKDSMVDALKKLSVHNLSNLSPHPLYVFLNYSHPPVLERIREIEKRESW